MIVICYAFNIMIPNFQNSSNRNLGSSLSLPAHGWVGARATSSLAAHFALQNTLSKSAEKKTSPSEGEAEWGGGGNSASPEPKRSPAALLVKSRTPKKSFVFLLKEKIGRPQNKNCEQNFFLVVRALASGGGAERQSSQSGFSSKKVRILTKRHRQSDNEKFNICSKRYAWALDVSKTRARY